VSRIVLLYNPAAAGGRDQSRTLAAVTDALRSRGHEVSLLATQGRGSAGAQVASLRADILFACGGDGTIHDAAQGLAFRTNIALGVLPMGSANALAGHLKLPRDPVSAALRQVDLTPRIIPMGRVRFTTPTGNDTRYFLVTAGAGADGMLVYKLAATSKRRLGRLAYYLTAARLALTEHLSEFALHCENPSEPAPDRAVTAMAARVGDLGGAFSPMMRGSRLGDMHLRLAAAHRPAWLSLPLWFVLSWLRLHAFNRFAFHGDVESFTCGEGFTGRVPVQADGDWLGYTPMTISLVPNALRILAPAEA